MEIFPRIENRIDCGRWAALLGSLCLLAIGLRRRSIWTVAGVILGFGVASWHLWVFM